MFCANALIAVGLVRVATDAGLRIPDDLAVVGFDDTDLASAASAVELTSVHQPATEIGRAAVHVLLEEMADRTREHRDLVFEPELVVRESSTVRQPRRRPSGRRSTSG
ncbi:substrate-binding protein-like domain-containing protein [Cryptosporangium aurantiacum]|uniref:Substrate-binding protein-like domain-containing protein n=1 Tax=Cryptosporangium aurantiacum TaxID=134849 RepID=A0A1M7PBQ4_9ACTN|nr:substrate-binding protein-like domain-containing protein [Cryptosporangium aurantiacum]